MRRPCHRCGRPRPTGRHCQPCHNERRRAAARRTDPLAITTTVETHHAPPGLRPRERRAIARHFTALGLSAAEIARILGVTPRTIHRWRAHDRQTAA